MQDRQLDTAPQFPPLKFGKAVFFCYSAAVNFPAGLTAAVSVAATGTANY